METIYAADSPLAAYLEGEGTYEPFTDDSDARYDAGSETNNDFSAPSFAPPATASPRPRVHGARLPNAVQEQPQQAQNALTRIHNAWSTAVNSRLGRADNERFLEHFRYTIVASQLLNEFLDHGSLQPDAVVPPNMDGTVEEPKKDLNIPASAYGAGAATVVAMVVAWLIDRLRASRSEDVMSTGRAVIVLLILSIIVLAGYSYNRRQRLRNLRHQAVKGVSALMTSWQAFELACSASLSFIQEVELVSKGFRLSTPLPPASRIEGSTSSRRCANLRHVLHKAYSSSIPASISALSTLTSLIDEDNLERYYEVYDISFSDAREALNTSTASTILEDDPESLKSLRLLSFQSTILRRITLCALMALDADGGHPDFHRWQSTNTALSTLTSVIGTSASRLRQTLTEMETISLPLTPNRNVSNGHSPKLTHPSRDRVRSQVHRISTLGTGIRGLRAKIQILREETTAAIDATEDITDLGPSLLTQYDSIGDDLQDLLRAWELGKKALQSNLSRQESRISRASMTSSSGMRSPVSSLGGLTAVEEGESLNGTGGGPEDALRSLNGDSTLTSSSFKRRHAPHPSLPLLIRSPPTQHSPSPLSSSPSDRNSDIIEPFTLPKRRVCSGGGMVFEAVALTPSSTLRRQRQQSLALTREERIARMNEERERIAAGRRAREASQSMLRELESVIRLREGLSGKDGEDVGEKENVEEGDKRGLGIEVVSREAI